MGAKTSHCLCVSTAADDEIRINTRTQTSPSIVDMVTAVDEDIEMEPGTPRGLWNVDMDNVEIEGLGVSKLLFDEKYCHNFRK